MCLKQDAFGFQKLHTDYSLGSNSSCTTYQLNSRGHRYLTPSLSSLSSKIRVITAHNSEDCPEDISQYCKANTTWYTGASSVTAVESDSLRPHGLYPTSLLCPWDSPGKTAGVGIERDTCTPTFITALFTIARTWKQPRCPSADEWIKKTVVNVHNGILLSY